MAFSWTDLTGGAHTRIWEHINDLGQAVRNAFGQMPTTATVNTGWSGTVLWTQVGQQVTVTVDVRRSGGNLVLTESQEVDLAPGLPVRSTGVPALLGVAFASNETSASPFAFGVDASGNLHIRSRGAQTITSLVYYSGSFTYVTNA